MILDGKLIAETLLQKIAAQIGILISQGITPTLAVILVGDDPGSLSYIKQKQKAGERVGIRVVFEHFTDAISPEILESAIAHYNADASVHGLIVQRPVPSFIGSTGNILDSVSIAKDVDGFLPNSPYQVPVARGVMTLLEHAHTSLHDQGLIQDTFLDWIRKERIAVIGRGETAGRPIAALLTKMECATSVITSATIHPESILKQSGIIISCVGKKEVIKKSYISNGTILISVGLWRDSAGKLHGDYESDDIQHIASFYTPTPGGVGPVNVASLMQNVVDACILQVGSRV